MDLKADSNSLLALSPEELLEFENLLDLAKSLVKRDSYQPSTKIKRMILSLHNSGVDDGVLRSVTPTPSSAKDGSPTATNCTNNQWRTRYPKFDIEESERNAGVNMHVELGEAVFLLDGQRFFVHVYKINEFAKIKDMVDKTRAESDLNEIELQCGAANFANMLQVLYSSMYNTNPFSVDILVSTLLVATQYEHPNLRAFAIKALATQHTLSPIKRIEVSRACSVPDWLPEAIDELCQREEPITLAEADKLGLETFVTISTRREQRKYSQGKIDGLKPQSQPQSQSYPYVVVGQ